MQASTSALIRDIMTCDVESIHETDSVAAVASKMANRKIRHLVVVDKDNKPQGVFSERDVLRHLVRFLKDRSSRPNPPRASMFVTNKMISVQPDAPIAEVASLMAKTKVGCVPVVGEDGTLNGIVSYVDILRYVGNDHDENESEADVASSEEE